MSKINLYNLEDLRATVQEARERATRGKSGIGFKGEVWLSHKRDGKFLLNEEYQGKNILPTEGLNSLLDTAIGGASQIATWYLGLFKNNYTPISTNTAANSLGVGQYYGECQDADYDTPATNRNTYTVVAASGGVLTNAAAPASFTMNASIPVYGAFIASSQAKTATTGKLLAAKLFSSGRSVVDSDVLLVTYQITASST